MKISTQCAPGTDHNPLLQNCCESCSIDMGMGSSQLSVFSEDRRAYDMNLRRDESTVGVSAQTRHSSDAIIQALCIATGFGSRECLSAFLYVSLSVFGCFLETRLPMHGPEEREVAKSGRSFRLYQ